MRPDDPRALHLVLVTGLDLAQRSTVRSALEKAAFQVEEVDDATSLVTLCDALWPDLVLLGSRVADERAASTCRELRASPSTARLPVLVLSTNPEHSTALDAGAFECLAAGPDSALLAHRARSAVRAARAESDAERARVLLAITQRCAKLGTFELFVGQERMSFSAEACRILGLAHEHEEWIARVNVVERITADGRPKVLAWFEQAVRGSSVAPLECGVQLQNGETRCVRLELGDARLFSTNGRSIAGVIQEVPSTREVEERVRQLLDSEGAIGIADRQRLLERLSDALHGASPPRDKVAILALHVDAERTEGNESPDDSSGEARERFVAGVARRIKDCVRGRDTLGSLGSRQYDISLARIGVDEFAVVVPGLIDAQDAYKVAHRIHEGLRTSDEMLSHGAPISIAIGIAVAPSDATRSEPLLVAAETALVSARTHTGERIRYFTPSMNVLASESHALEAGLRTAIERNELAVHYQPRVEIATGKIVGFEALVRWQHPELGMISPAQFIPLAEATGLIIPIGEHVLSIACAQAKRWQDDGLPPVCMAVNLSSVQFMEPDLEVRIARVLAETGLAPQWLELELTESILLRNVEATLATLVDIKAMGVHLSIDDFGTGYSSLSYLKRFPVDALKIDQSFIRDVTTNPDDAAITTSILLMGRSLKLRVVAEGVETRSQLAFLRVLECDEAQGYLFSRPLPAVEAGALLAKGLAPV
jgi:predicted signal transduction protein with EAL and GGDEF domain/DNA-binding response OmpR family regulator